MILQIPSLRVSLDDMPDDPVRAEAWVRSRRVDNWVRLWGLDINDEDVRRRIGEIIQYRQTRGIALADARAAKARGDLEHMQDRCRAARSNQKVVLRRLRNLRVRAALVKHGL